MFSRCSALVSTILFDMRSVSSKFRLLDGRGDDAEVKDAHIGGLMDLRLSDGDIKIPDTDETMLDPFACTCCNERIARVRFHMSYSTESGESESRPHMYCGACVQNTIIAQWRKKGECPAMPLVPRPVQAERPPYAPVQRPPENIVSGTTIGRRRATSGGPVCTWIFSAAAHDARARWYAIAAARAASRAG
jgi:hypothetical protein